VIGNQALVLKNNGDFDGALKLLEQKYGICRKLKYKEGIGEAMIDSAAIYGIDMKQNSRAIQMIYDAMEFCRSEQRLVIKCQQLMSQLSPNN